MRWLAWVLFTILLILQTITLGLTVAAFRVGLIVMSLLFFVFYITYTALNMIFVDTMIKYEKKEEKENE